MTHKYKFSSIKKNLYSRLFNFITNAESYVSMSRSTLHGRKGYEKISLIWYKVQKLLSLILVFLLLGDTTTPSFFTKSRKTKLCRRINVLGIDPQ